MIELKAGQRVAIFKSHHFADDTARYATVARLTATQAILDNGERYRLKDGRKVGEDYYRSPELADPADPRVVAVEVRAVVGNVRREVETLLKSKGASTPAAGRELLWKALGIVERGMDRLPAGD